VTTDIHVGISKLEGGALRARLYRAESPPLQCLRVAESFGAFVGGFFTRAAGIAAAMLPVRLWRNLDGHLPVTESAFIASLLTLLAGAAIGIPGFLTHATEQAAYNTQAMLNAAATAGDGQSVDSSMSVGMSSLSLFTFLLLTPLGWATTYLGLTGLARTVAAALDEPHGDFFLTVVDKVLVRSVRGGQAYRTRTNREQLEGPDVPDRVVPGAQLGLPDAQLVVVASRRKPDWDAGTVVVTNGPIYRVGVIVERTIHGRLRTLYPLTEHKDFETFRRTVRYELPDKPR